MRWDLFAILMLVPWAATFLGSLTAVKVSLKTPRRQGGLLGFAAGVMVAAAPPGLPLNFLAMGDNVW